jgi:acyl-coenzyme A thioesterase PaaI-like protein
MAGHPRPSRQSQAGATPNAAVGTYQRPATDTALVVTATVRRSGRLVGIVDIEVANQAGQLVAIGRATYATAG